MKIGMIFRRVWFHKTGEEVLDRKVLDINNYGFWVEDTENKLINEQGLWVDWMSSTDWAFSNGKIYMLFNHNNDMKQKEKKLTAQNFAKYKERFQKYVDEELPKGLQLEGCKVLGIYEVWGD